jgi:hypothetical protein
MSADRATSHTGSRWTCASVSLLGAFEVLMALGAGSELIRVVGIVGGLALASAPWVVGQGRGMALALLVVGTVPFAALTPTSLISPVLAIVAWFLLALIWAVPGPSPLGRVRRPVHDPRGSASGA